MSRAGQRPVARAAAGNVAAADRRGRRVAAASPRACAARTSGGWLRSASITPTTRRARRVEALHHRGAEPQLAGAMDDGDAILVARGRRRCARCRQASCRRRSRARRRCRRRRTPRRSRGPAPRGARARCRSARRWRSQACCREREARVARECALAEGGLRSCSRVILDHPRLPAPVCRGVVNAGPGHPVTATPDISHRHFFAGLLLILFIAVALRGAFPTAGSAVASASWHHVARRRSVGAQRQEQGALGGMVDRRLNPISRRCSRGSSTSPSSRSASDSGRRESSRWRWGRSRFCSLPWASAHQRADARRLSRRRCSPAITAGCSGIASRCSRPRWCRSSRYPGALRARRTSSRLGALAGVAAWLAFFSKASAAFYIVALGLEAVTTVILGLRARENPNMRNRAGAALWTLAGLAIAAALFLVFFAIPHWSEVRFYNWQMSVTRKPTYGLAALISRASWVPAVNDFFLRQLPVVFSDWRALWGWPGAGDRHDPPNASSRSRSASACSKSSSTMPGTSGGS